MRHLIAGLLLALAASAGAKEAAPLAEDPVVEQRLIAISEELRCLVCQNESLAGSRSGLAEDLRREVREQIRQGRTDQEIRDFMVSRYGDFVLYRPPLKASTWLLWVGPFLGLIGAVATLLVYLRRQSRTAREEPVDLTEQERAQAAALLTEGER